jgi:hypothetical protein
MSTNKEIVVTNLSSASMKVKKKVLEVDPAIHYACKVNAFNQGMFLGEFIEQLLLLGLGIYNYIPDDVPLGECLSAFQKSLKCKDKEDLFKILWVNKLGNEWPPNIEAK